MICMSPSSSTKIIEEVTNSYDEDILSWKDEIGKVAKFGYFMFLLLLTSVL